MFLETLVILSLSQQVEVRKPVVVVASSKRPGTDAVLAQIVARIRDTVAREGITDVMADEVVLSTLKSAGIKDSKTCQGSTSCLSKLAILIGPKAVVVGVDVGKVGKTLAVHLEAMAADQEKPLAALDASASLDEWNETLAVPFVTFVRQLKPQLALKQPEIAKVDKPVETVLIPTVKVEETPVIIEEKPIEVKPVKIAPWLALGGAVLAAAGAATFGILAAGDNAKFEGSLVTLPDGTRGSTLSQADAAALVSGRGVKTGVAIGTGVAAVGLGSLAAYLFSQPD